MSLRHLFHLCAAAIGACALSAPLPRWNTRTPNAIFARGSGGFSFATARLGISGALVPPLCDVKLSDKQLVLGLDTETYDFVLDKRYLPQSSLVDTLVPGSIPISSNVTISGEIYVAALDFNGLRVEQQALLGVSLEVFNESTFQGVFGLAPPARSYVKQNLTLAHPHTTYNGKPILENIFSLYPDKPSFITLLLPRDSPGSNTSTRANFTIGELILPAIADAQKLPVIESTQAWVTLMDGVQVNGLMYSGHGILSNATDLDPVLRQELVAEISTAISLTLLPQYYVDTIYGSIPGAQQDSQYPGVWAFPCETVLNVSFVFNGTSFPIHPIDLAIPGIDGNGNTLCFNGIGASDPDRLDVVLGKPFLKSTYVLLQYGNYTTGRQGDPYIQFLSVVDSVQAPSEYNAYIQAELQYMRTELNLTTSPLSGSQSSALQTPSASSLSVSSPVVLGAIANDGSEPTGVGLNQLLRNSYIIIGLLAGTLVLVLIAFVWVFVSSRGTVGGKYASVPKKELFLPQDSRGAYETPYDS